MGDGWMMRTLAVLAVFVAGGTAHAEPCPSFKLASKVLAKSAVGGVVVGEVPEMDDFKHTITTARDAWRVRVGGGKPSAATPDTIAPGLVVYRLPKDAKKLELFDAGKKLVGTATAGKAAALEAPQLASVVSGQTKSKHVTRFVDVELAKAAPAGALALVLVDGNGIPMAWGVAVRETRQVTVYSTQGGCVLEFPEGTVVAEVGKPVSAFWIDAGGRRSATSAKIVVTAPND